MHHTQGDNDKMTGNFSPVTTKRRSSGPVSKAVNGVERVYLEFYNQRKMDCKSKDKHRYFKIDKS